MTLIYTTAFLLVYSRRKKNIIISSFLEFLTLFVSAFFLSLSLLFSLWSRFFICFIHSILSTRHISVPEKKMQQAKRMFGVSACFGRVFSPLPLSLTTRKSYTDAHTQNKRNGIYFKKASCTEKVILTLWQVNDVRVKKIIFLHKFFNE